MFALEVVLVSDAVVIVLVAAVAVVDPAKLCDSPPALSVHPLPGSVCR